MTNKLFVDFISRLSIKCENKGIKAIIKRSKSHSVVSQTAGVMEVMELRPPDKCFDICHQVSVWYAIHSMHAENKTFGESLVELKSKMKSDMIDNKVLTLARYNRKRMIREIDKLIFLFKQHKVAIDYASLIEDIKYWSKRYKHNSVQCRWIQNYSKVKSFKVEKEKEYETH